MDQFNMGAIRRIANMTIQDMAKYTNIPEKRLEAIEAETEEPSTAELRDIALALGTNVRGLCGTAYFGIHLSAPSERVAASNKGDLRISGYWGHIGILPEGQKEYLWFPILDNAKEIFYQQTPDTEHSYIPTANNKLLMLNMRHIAEIIIVDDSRDAPAFVNWDPSVNDTIVSPVIYEALEDYECDHGNENAMSPAFEKTVQDFIKNLNGHAEDFMHMTSVYYKNGLIRKIYLSEDSIELYEELFVTLDLPEVELSDITFEDMQGAVSTINMSHVAMMVMPLAQAEAAFDNRRY